METEKDLRQHYKVGDIVKYYGSGGSDIKPGEIIRVTKVTVKVKYKGYTLTLSKVKMPAFLNDLQVQGEIN